MENGTWILFGKSGYYVTDQNLKSFNYNLMPMSSYLLLPGDYNTVWGMYLSAEYESAPEAFYLVQFTDGQFTRFDTTASFEII